MLGPIGKYINNWVCRQRLHMICNLKLYFSEFFPPTEYCLSITSMILSNEEKLQVLYARS